MKKKKKHKLESPAAALPIGYSKAELQTILDGMQAISVLFYGMAQKVGFHEFLEFTGFLNEHIKLCQQALAAGLDFTQAGPPIQSYEAAYIGEKFGCIFRESFAGKGEAIEAFCRMAFGVNVKIDREPAP